MLASAECLRRWGLGQIDVAVILSPPGREQEILLLECKQRGEISPIQTKRLRKAALFLSHLLNIPSRLSVFTPDKTKIGQK